jgi:carboxyl-terminal processing protease
LDDYYGDLGRRFAHGELEQKDSIHYNDTVKYYTRNKRVVFGGGGIMPDIFVPVDTSGISPYYMKMTQKGLVYQFAFDYSDQYRDELGKLKSGKEFDRFLKERNILKVFIDFGVKKGLPTESEGLRISGKIIEAQLIAYISRNIIGEEGFYSAISSIDAALIEALKALDKKDILVQSN